MTRTAIVERATRETEVRIALDLGGGEVALQVDHGFLAHLLEQLGRHGRLGLDVRGRGDVDTVDVHHLAEDVGIVLGQALARALGDRHGIERYGHAWVPMDETLAHVVVDLSGRPYLAFEPSGFEGDAHGFHAHHLRELLRGFANHAGATVHVRVLAGVETHHVCEAIVKAFARALRDAVATTGDALPSTKGVL
jgi:imidazoleglycerol-phosphate dehydratase